MVRACFVALPADSIIFLVFDLSCRTNPSHVRCASLCDLQTFITEWERLSTDHRFRANDLFESVKRWVHEEYFSRIYFTRLGDIVKHAGCEKATI